MYSEEKMREINKRENKGVRDLVETEDSVNGVFELDGEFSNGYHIYVPYGISVDLLDAVNTSIQALEHQASDVQKSIDELKKGKDEISTTLATSLELVKKEFDIHVKTLRAFAEIPQSV